MPYDASNAPAYVKKMPKKKRDQWIAVWNSAYDACMKDKNDNKACETSAFKQANGVVKKNSVIDLLIENMRSTLNAVLGYFVGDTSTELEKLALSIPNMYGQVGRAVRDRNSETEWEWLVDCYIDTNGSLFVITAKDGKLYRSDLEISNESVSVGSPVEVAEVFQPVSQQLQIQKKEDGTYRWFLFTGSTVLNRGGFMNSKTFFDNMFKRCEETKKYPTLDFMHLGINDEFWDIGAADWLARDENIAMASGTFYDTPLAKAAQKALESNPEIWGASNAYYPLSRKTVEVADGIELKVDEDGIYDSIALLPEKEACSLFTSADITKENIMNDRVKKALELLVGDDKDLLAQLEERADKVNQLIADENLIHQNAPSPDPAVETPDPQPPVQDIIAQPVVTTSEPLQLDLTDELVAQIAGKVKLPAFVTPEEFVAQAKELASTKDAMTALASTVAEQEKVIKQLQSFVDDLRKTETQKKQEFLGDMPRSQRVNVGYRPREAAPTAPQAKEKQSKAEIAAATLGILENK